MTTEQVVSHVKTRISYMQVGVPALRSVRLDWDTRAARDASVAVERNSSVAATKKPPAIS